MDLLTHNPHYQQAKLFAANGVTSAWWLADATFRHGPSWPMVPPLLLAVASLIGAIKSFQDGAQARRHAEEKHRTEMVAATVRRYDPLFNDFGLDAPRN